MLGKRLGKNFSLLPRYTIVQQHERPFFYTLQRQIPYASGTQERFVSTKLTARERREKKHAENLKKIEARRKLEREELEKQLKKQQEQAEASGRKKKSKPPTSIYKKPPKKSVEDCKKNESAYPPLFTINLDTARGNAKKLDLASFIQTHQNVDMQSPVRIFRNSKQMINDAQTQIDNILKNDIGLVEGDSTNSNSLNSLPLEKFRQSIEAIERINDETQTLLKTMMVILPDQFSVEKQSISQMLNGFKLFVNNRYESNMKLYKYAKEKLVEGGRSEKQKQFLITLMERRFKHPNSLCQIEDVYARNAIFDLQQDVEKKKADFLKELQNNVSMVEMESPTRLYEIPREEYAKVKKKRVKKKKIGEIDLLETMHPILSDVSNQRVRHFVIEKIRTKFENEKSPLIVYLNQYRNAAAKLSNELKQPSYVHYSMNTSSDALEMDQVVRDTIEKIQLDMSNKLPDHVAEIAKLKTTFNAELYKKHFQPSKKSTEQTEQEAAVSKPKRGKQKRVSEATVHPFAEEQSKDLLPHDLLFFSKMFYDERIVHNTEEIRQFFPLHSCLEGLKYLLSNLLDIELEPCLIGPYESWNPKFVKKMKLVEKNSGKHVANFYLDVCSKIDSRQGYQKFLYVEGIPSMMLCLNLKEPLIMHSPTLSHSQLRSLFKEVGKVIPFIVGLQTSGDSIIHSSKLNLAQSTNLTSLISGYAFEQFTYNTVFLQSFAKHYISNTPISSIRDHKTLLNDYVAFPTMFPLEVMNNIAHSVIDLDLFSSDTTVNDTLSIMRNAENKVFQFGCRLLYDLKLWERCGGTLALDIYSRAVACDIIKDLTISREKSSMIQGSQKFLDFLHHSMSYTSAYDAIHKKTLKRDKVDSEPFVSHVYAKK